MFISGDALCKTTETLLTLLGIRVGWNVNCGTDFCLNSLVSGKFLKRRGKSRHGGEEKAMVYCWVFFLSLNDGFYACCENA